MREALFFMKLCTFQLTADLFIVALLLVISSEPHPGRYTVSKRMKLPNVKYTVISVAATLISIVIFLMPFHAFLTVWGASLIGHYTALRLWKEALLVIIALCACVLLLTDDKIRSHTLSRRLVWTILGYCLLLATWGVIRYVGGDVTNKAFGFGMIIDLRFPIFFLLTWAVTLRTNRLKKRGLRFVLIPATVVIVFGLLQILVLPRAFLTHFGYGPNTISPFETINHNVQYIRIASTLRGANPLGTYIIVPISLLVTLLASGRRRWQELALLAGALIVLFFTFSRGAWVGAVVSVGIVLAVQYRTVLLRKQSLLIAGAAFAVLLGAGLSLRHNARIENVFLHTETHSAIKTTSNQGHLDALKTGLKDVEHHPLGQGVGTSGPASVYNSTTRIPENYFLQIGEEAGWLGVALFVLMNLGVGFLLWLRRHDPLALCLIASLVGISVVNLLSQAWSDDTIAYVWWGLAGIAMVDHPVKRQPRAQK